MQYDIQNRLKVLDSDCAHTVEYSHLNQSLLPGQGLGSGKIYNFSRRLAAGDSVTFDSQVLRLADIKYIQVTSSAPVRIAFTGGTPMLVTFMSWDYPLANTEPLQFTLSRAVGQAPVDVRVVMLGRESPYIS